MRDKYSYFWIGEIGLDRGMAGGGELAPQVFYQRCPVAGDCPGQGEWFTEGERFTESPVVFEGRAMDHRPYKVFSWKHPVIGEDGPVRGPGPTGSLPKVPGAAGDGLARTALAMREAREEEEVPVSTHQVCFIPFNRSERLPQAPKVFFSFGPCTARFLFFCAQKKRKWGVQ